MQYSDTIDESRSYLRLALEQLGKHQLPTDPLNYCVWYEYASGKNDRLTSTIDTFLERQVAFSPEISQQLYGQFISNGGEALTSLIQKELKKVLTTIFGAIRTTNQSFSESETNLETMNQALVPTLSEAAIETIVTQVKQEINRLESTSNSFKDEIRQANREIDLLKMKMERYRREALKDPLTQIDNRRGFDKKLADAIRAADETGKPLCLAIADIDHFKQVNDTYGHLVGDNVIRMVARTMKAHIKGKDLVASVGGEEFALLLPDTPYDGALKLAQDMCRVFSQLDLKKKNTGESLKSITLSFGVTRYRPRETAETFVKRADEALYRSKETGRNRVTGL
jgi:diguanylate cyclase